jgi:hypothetical protein
MKPWNEAVAVVAVSSMLCVDRYGGNESRTIRVDGDELGVLPSGVS